MKIDSVQIPQSRHHEVNGYYAEDWKHVMKAERDGITKKYTSNQYHGHLDGKLSRLRGYATWRQVEKVNYSYLRLLSWKSDLHSVQVLITTTFFPFIEFSDLRFFTSLCNAHKLICINQDVKQASRSPMLEQRKYVIKQQGFIQNEMEHLGFRFPKYTLRIKVCISCFA